MPALFLFDVKCFKEVALTRPGTTTPINTYVSLASATLQTPYCIPESASTPHIRNGSKTFPAAGPEPRRSSPSGGRSKLNLA
ncbi:hypothetical protein SBV1_360035 [Verrucomicrobia bacterium]|nr:hypothetical protein SBV1_360035 [Verrucomicrobiota bacterium]